MLFVARPVLSRFTHFLCGDKLRPKYCPWRKNDKYNLNYLFHWIRFVFFLAADIIQVSDLIPWVRCASGNFFSSLSRILLQWMNEESWTCILVSRRCHQSCPCKEELQCGQQGLEVSMRLRPTSGDKPPASKISKILHVFHQMICKIKELGGKNEALSCWKI